ncbi:MULTISPECIES: transporter substrate-binding domain-containing protein [Mesorhizobium]|uniref:transporter substrate-binding domain-containing protein n=1 Tax=Mesorhizobium TaxID=68287 RepID=UPI0007EC42E0|nr:MULTISPECIES: transporter substrate-binding domain-containing protein [Mesorhizobium]TPJ37399.1 transporter substrate-binding domain-containing protein [Mesorhizobium sp. B2-6-6]ARP68107.1 amino acid ABC transporter substrate-binding protein [Mesorhizobium sp. WSM1497]MCA0004173.1 transporter substrate-binding domain-containing protein [Mesorhizobium sp. B264B2A]MCA0010396.1 transporter substrate-binding domain-containing protein [Mesorhizobium sp. B264B1B]MCA0016603.1 transporter substrate
MNKIVTIITAASLSIASVVYSTSVYAGEVLQRVLNTKTLRVAVGTDWGAMSSLNANHELEGYDIDVAKGVAKSLGVNVEFVTPGWDIIAAGNWQGRWDISMGQMTPTKTRAEKFDYSTTYFYEKAAVIVHNDSKASTLSDLNGKIVGVSAGTLAEDYVNQNFKWDWIGARPEDYKFKAGEVKVYTSTGVALDDLRLGDGTRLHAILTDGTLAERAIKSGYPFKVLGSLFATPAAIPMMKGDKEFSEKVSAALKSMKDDGTLSTLSIKWYGSDHSVEN